MGIESGFDSRPIMTDVRIVAATNRSLDRAISQGRLRHDLVYELPALRDRPDDLLLLIQHFIHEFNRQLNQTVQGASPEFLEALRSRTWPGNIREVRNVVQRALSGAILQCCPQETCRRGPFLRIAENRTSSFGLARQSARSNAN